MADVLGVIVHAGAGYHAKVKEKFYNSLCSEACQVAATLLVDGKGAIEAVTAAVKCLEDSPLTNAGFGSNLTINGYSECDAGLMCGKSLRFAGVGAVPGVKNPIVLTKCLLEEQIRSPKTTLGRVCPTFLSGPGARQWALSKVPHCISEPELISEKSYNDWKKYRGWLDAVEDHKSIPFVDSNDAVNLPKIPRLTPLDTVGAVCIDKEGNIASAASSGGIALKQEGRIGQACVYGCGCWAEQSDEYGTVGIVTSGTGEQLIRTQLAQRSSERFLSSPSESVPEILKLTLQDDFLNSRFLREDDHRFAGLAGIFYPANNAPGIEVFFGHTTRSMSTAYFFPGVMSNPLASVSRKSADKPMRLSAFAHCL